MPKKKATEEAVETAEAVAETAESGAEEAENVAEASETAAETTETAAETKSEPLMYVGPTIPTFAIQNTVYSKISDTQKAVIKKYPELGNLFVKVPKYAEANRMLREKKGYIYSAYVKALQVKNGGKK